MARMLKEEKLSALPEGLHFDGGRDGLAFRRRGDRRTFVLRYVVRATGERRQNRLGAWPGMTLAAARRAARKARVKIDQGHDPVGEKIAVRTAAERARRDAITFSGIADQYLAATARVKRLGTASEDRRRVAGPLAVWKSVPATAITNRDARLLHAELPGRCSKGSNAGHTEANRVLQLAAVIFSWAAEKALLPDGHANPCRGIRRHAEPKRRRRATDDELRAVLASLGPEPADARAFVVLLILTAARKTELLSARWQDVVTEDGRTALYIASPKTDEPRSVPLSREAVAVLDWWKRNLRVPNPEGWLFPSTRGTGPRTATWADMLWRRVRERAGCPDVRAHDLRRTLGAWSMRRGHGRDLTADALGHRSLASTMVYTPFDLDAGRPLLDEYGAHLAKLADEAGVSLPTVTVEILESDPSVGARPITLSAVDPHAVGTLALGAGDERDDDEHDDAPEDRA